MDDTKLLSHDFLKNSIFKECIDLFYDAILVFDDKQHVVEANKPAENFLKLFTTRVVR
ncbi:hypothetical protein [Fastidiosibacter lacustris]|uniref:hypothetical protein n=1 Tax=Fastidiosibacter lacustris TaxID=2056695 RepID=UPI0013006B72|nr:hypothetical protein [Fastidiosibacter lacustris]